MHLAAREKSKSLPDSPGCYLMKDGMGRVIYVGKAKSLKSRVANYFSSAARDDMKTRALVEVIADFEVILTTTEVEALLLERTLIKHHKPTFNVTLRDDKEYPYLRVNLTEDWPRLEKVRRRKEDGAVYLGPFGSAGQLRLLMDAAARVFPLIRCSRHEFHAAKRPCNYYQLKMCLGPCTLPVDRARYVAMVEDALDFIRGKNKEVARTLKERMERAATAEEYEVAAMYRDQLQAFENVTEKQSVIAPDVPDADVVGIETAGEKTVFHVLTVRESKLIHGDAFVVTAKADDTATATTAFLMQYYDGRSLPHEVLVPIVLPDAENIRLALLTSHPDATSFELKVPSRGTRADLVAMAQKNAQFRLGESSREEEKSRVELEVVRDTLKLRRLPRRMECIDISNFQGGSIVASKVAFLDGKPDKEHYRHYRIETVVGAPDDFASIREVVARRLKRGIEEGDLPDLLVIDGGKGQLSAAMDAMVGLPPLDMELVSLAKSKVDKRIARAELIDTGAATRSYERVFFPGREAHLPLAPGTPAFRLLTRLRDEAHRFAITHHRKVRAKTSSASVLTDVRGIGETLRKRLLTQFGGMDGLAKASLHELSAVSGMSEATAVALHGHLRALEDNAATGDAVDGEAPVSGHDEPISGHEEPL